jgi:two-component system sensor histidine kinase NreB
MWHLVRRTARTYRELVLAVVFVCMAAWELLEMWMLEPWRGPVLSRGALLHGVQVAVILAATYAVLRAWREKTAREERLARLVEQVLFAQEQERRRIGYDVHDGIAQLIVSAKQHLDTYADLQRRDDPAAARQLGKAVDRLQLAIVETRRILAALRPSAVDAAGLVDAARRSLEECAQEAGWSVSFAESVGDARLPPAVETAAFRILQEALANARRHAGTSRVAVELRREPDALCLDVRDAGRGLPDADDPARSRGLGLLSMRERARLLGGVCTIESDPARGTAIRVRLPLGHGADDPR